MDYSPELIPDEDQIYKRIHKMWIKPEGIEPSAFTNSPRESESMSVDWSKYSKPKETRVRANNPIDNAVVQFEVSSVRNLPGQTVEHAPVLENRSHSDVIGQKTPHVRVLLSRIYTLIIPLEEAL
jgi:hypothetical protein